MKCEQDCHVIDEENDHKIVASFDCVVLCEAYIIGLAQSEWAKVHRGGFGIDAPELKVNP